MKNKKWWRPERSKRRPSDKLFAVVEEVLENPDDYESLTKSRPIKIAKEFLNDAVDLDDVLFVFESLGQHIGDAVFMTPHLYEAERYGGDIVEIDVWKMLQDGHTPEAVLEENVNENNMRKIIADKIGLHLDFSDEYYSLGVDPDTIVIFGDIPRKYLRPEGYDT